MFYTKTGIDSDDIVYWVITVDLTQGQYNHKTNLKPSSISFLVFQWDAIRKIEIHHMQMKEKLVHFLNFVYTDLHFLWLRVIYNGNTGRVVKWAENQIVLVAKLRTPFQSCEIAIPLSKSNCDCETLWNRNCAKLRKL